MRNGWEKRQFLALRFCRSRLNGSTFNNLAGALHTTRVGCTLSVGREVKMEIPAKMSFPASVSSDALTKDSKSLAATPALATNLTPSVQTTPTDTAAAERDKSELILSQQFLDGKHGTRNGQAAAKSLWRRGQKPTMDISNKLNCGLTGALPGAVMDSINRTTRLTTKDATFIGASVLLLAVCFLVSRYLVGEKALIFLIIAGISIVIGVQIEIYHRVAAHLDDLRKVSEMKLAAESQNYKQIESLVQVISLLKLNAPLPPMRVWAISPDFAALIIGLIRESQPAVVLELGSGVSTLVAAYALQMIGQGKVVSLDHDEQFARLTEGNIRKHGLANIAKVVCSDLREVAIGRQKYQWYGTNELNGLEPIGMLIVDGPPAHVLEMARYPALPILWNHLRDNAVIIVDDAKRNGEKKMLELWINEYPELIVESVDTEAGAAILRRIKRETPIDS